MHGKFYSMQIRHKLFLLLGVPLVCQLGFTGWLAYSHAQLDTLVAQEAKAKKIISLVVQVREKVEQTFLRLAVKRVIGHDAEVATKERAQLKEYFEALKDLTKDNPKAQTSVARASTDCDLFLETWLDLMSGYKAEEQQIYFAQFFGHEDFADELEFRFRGVNKNADDLIEIYSPIAKELQPRESKAREDLRRLIFGSMIFNVLLVVGMASLINKNTISRLSILMKNMTQFSKGIAPTEKLTGDDELVELDKAFSAMAAERNRLEDIRKSLRAMVSHDLRSPLTSMGLRLEMMIENEADSDEQLSPSVQNSLQRLLNETHRLRRLANTLLDVEKMQDGNLELKLEHCPIEQIVSTAIGAVQSQALSKKVTIKFIELPAAVNQECICDSDRTIQVLINFLSNAIKFTPTKSTITVGATQLFGATRFEVTDEGPGIPDDQVEKLFSKFSQLDQPEEVKKLGSGLGLYICKMLIEAHSGKLGYQPGTSGGSCFWFEIPNPGDVVPGKRLSQISGAV